MASVYDEALKKRVVQEFIKQNRRAPTEVELREKIRAAENAYPLLENVGFTAYDTTIPKFKSHASASAESKNQKAILDDCLAVNKRISRALIDLDDSAIGLDSTLSRISRTLDTLESRIDSVLLRNNLIQTFVASIEETFDAQDKIDFDRTSALVELGSVSLNKAHYSQIENSLLTISASPIAAKGIIGTSVSEDMKLLFEDDGSVWNYLVYTQYQVGRLSLVMQIELTEPMYVGSVRITSAGTSVNSLTTVTRQYSVDGLTFKALEPAEQALRNGENEFYFGKDNVSKLQLIVSKEAADNTTTNNQYVYAFSFDSIKVTQDTFITDDDVERNNQSELVVGPYDVVDYLGMPVYFTKAICNACTYEPEGTSVNFFLSNDGETWHSSSHTDLSLRLVSFGNESPSAQTVLIADRIHKELAPDVIIDEMEANSESLLNIYIPSTISNIVPISSIVIQRNIAEGTSNIYSAPRGWRRIGSEYKTTLYIDSPNGRWLDLGTTSAFINGVRQTGKVFLPEGYSQFRTSDRHYLPINETLTNIQDLLNNDPLYPYNHKYLIEGYPYGKGFSGEKIYFGVSDYFAALLRYVSPEQFVLEPAQNLEIFTIIDLDGDLLFKVKVDKTSATWKDEKFSVTWSEHSSSTNQLWVRAVLSSRDASISPRIEDFQVRVI